MSNDRAHLEYRGHVRLWCVVHRGAIVRSYRTRQSAQRHMNRLNSEQTL